MERSPSDAAGLGGVIAVVAMPFTPNGSVDHAALEREVAYLIDREVDGIALGYGSESTELTDRERDEAMATIATAVGGRCPVVAHVTATSAPAAAERIAASAAAGAGSVMVAPPPAPASEIAEFFQRLAEAGTCEILIQDAPAASGTVMSEELLLDLCSLPAIRAVKVETPDAFVRIATLRSRLPATISLLGGSGAVRLMSELRAGCDGTMPGAGNAAALVRIVRLYRSGRMVEAEAAFASLLPLLVLASATPALFLWVQKELLRREAVIEHTELRSAAIPADPSLRGELAHLLAVSEATGQGSEVDV